MRKVGKVSATLTGAEAATEVFSQLVAMDAGGRSGKAMLHAMAPLKPFTWLLDRQSLREFRCLITKHAAVASKNSLDRDDMIEDGDTEAIVVAGSSGAASSASCEKVESLVPVSKKEDGR